MLWELFAIFIRIGLISFGGGYAVMALIQREIAGKGWVDGGEFQELVAISGMAPGSIATNIATLIGYTEAGVPGAVAATAGIILPSFLIVVFLAAFFIRVHNNDWIRALFYGLRPVVTGLIIYSALHFGFSGRSGSWISWSMGGTLLIIAGCFILVSKYKLHPFSVILLAAVAGIVIF